jgi:sterol desaturase/sphingolipid hydroxylase (fatty acid hydroxylase superfamily)
MPDPITLFLDPIVLMLVGIYVLGLAAELVLPSRKLLRLRSWRLKGAAFFTLSILVSSYAPFAWDGWFAEHSLIDASGLGHVGGAVAGFLLFQVLLYGWHRLIHRVDFLWRWFHQLHHSAERVDVAGAFYFHPLDVAGLSALTSLTLVFLLGVTAPAAVAVALALTFCTVFQHANVKTPRWLGYIIQRPESHSVHHQRGVHAFNYADLPIIDMIFGTFRNPEVFAQEAGFHDGASRRVLPMLLGRDVSLDPAEAGQPAAESAPTREAA